MTTTRLSDFRSDTVTQPTPAMREAMARAVVGDDVMGEDPTIRQLEKLAAEKMGKEAALFVTSGTQGNLIGVLSQTRPGDEVLLTAESHIYYYEVGGMSALAGTIPHLVPISDGLVTSGHIKEAVRGENIHFPRTTLLCLENTHNRGGGTVMTPEQTKEACLAAHEAGLKVHLDGARIFNAAVALKCDVADLTAPVDSVMFCLSKGLGAPVGSLLAGREELIGEARRWRKMLGGGMRQAGVLAAAGIVALEQMTERLAEDHRLARLLGESLSRIPGLTVDLSRLQTNIIVADVQPEWGDAQKFLDRLREEGVLGSHFGPQKVRFVVHKDIDSSDGEALVEAAKKVIRG